MQDLDSEPVKNSEMGIWIQVAEVYAHRVSQ